jgi:hypothetical protein
VGPGVSLDLVQLCLVRLHSLLPQHPLLGHTDLWPAGTAEGVVHVNKVTKCPLQLDPALAVS